MIILLSITGTMLVLLGGVFASLISDSSVTSGGKCAVCCLLWAWAVAGVCFYFAYGMQ